MKVKAAIFVVSIVTLANTCCKEEGPKLNSIIGEWSIERIDSIRSVSGLPFNAFVVSTIPWMGKIEFSDDSSGRFVPVIQYITDTVSEFIWSHNKITNQISFDFTNGNTFAFIKSQLSDTLELYLKSYRPNQAIGVIWFYYFKLAKNQE